MIPVDFVAHLHEPFQVQFNPVLTMGLVLNEVHKPSSTITKTKLSEDTDSVVVIFQGPQSPVLPTRTYKLSHHRLGKVEIHLAPYERKQAGMCYKAVVSSPS